MTISKIGTGLTDEQFRELKKRVDLLEIKEKPKEYEVDKLLYLLVDRRYTAEECVAAGFKTAFVQTVIERVRRNHFKRTLPLIAKLSNRTVGYDFLYLRDWGT